MEEAFINTYAEDYIELLKRLIRIPSFSKEEDKTADCLALFLQERGVQCFRSANNIWAYSHNFHSRPDLPIVLLNSHHDTVKDNASWTYPPFEAVVEGEKIIGLGSNDAGASLVSLMASFQYFNTLASSPFRCIIALVGEEEITGQNGLRSVLPQLGNIDFAIVGEPTQTKVAIAEKGLLVVDATSKGRSGHVGRGEGINAIYQALQDIAWIRSFSFPNVSPSLGAVSMHVTQIHGGYQHNVTPDACTYTIDIRTNEYYTHEDVLNILSENISATLKPRSTHLRSSFTPQDHPVIDVCRKLNIESFGSPTISDWCVIKDIASIKMGPGHSSRSHQPDEYIYTHEIREGIRAYIRLLSVLYT